MKKISFLMIAGMLTQLSLNVQGASPGGSDSCGLGWQVTKDKTMSATTTRTTTNASVPPTLGMTTGTLGCDRHGIAASDAPAVNYVSTNINGLKHEIAMGEGDILSGLAQIMGRTDTKTFSQVLKRCFSKIFPHEQIHATETFKNIKKISLSECQA